jgi:hypothetical protein
MPSADELSRYAIPHGFVYLPTEADWLWDYYRELVAFPLANMMIKLIRLRRLSIG